jgi:DNA-binding transcriptional LysR family regulator
MKSLAGILAFIKAADTGSFTRAAQLLDVTPAAVSKGIQRLEDQLETRLFHRTTRQLSLTEDGQRYYESCAQAIRDIEEAGQTLVEHHGTPIGLLRVSSSVAFGHTVLLPLMPAFLERYPQLQVEIILDDHIVDIVTDRFDVALRAGRLPDSGMVARKLFSFAVGLYASPAYLKRYGEPKTLEDLARHNCIQFRFASTNRLLPWEFVSEGEKELVSIATSGSLTLSDPSSITQMCAAGVGIGLLADYLAQPKVASGELKQILRKHTLETRSLYACYPTRKHAPLKTKVFVDYLNEAIKVRGN